MKLNIIIGLLSSTLLFSAENSFENKRLEKLSTGEWWKHKGKNSLMVPRDKVVAFGLYTQENGTLKLSAQLYPLLPDEKREAHLEIKVDGEWQRIATSKVHELGWSAHFKVTKWDDSKSVAYRVRHGKSSEYIGTIRKTPKEKDEIVVASLSCNSSLTPGQRSNIVKNVLFQNPDLVFFAGDQTYRHTEHTAGWLEFGEQFKELFRDRPVITIPDDHDIGQDNLWGNGGGKSSKMNGSDGGYFFSAAYVNMVQRQQTWHLPDAVDPEPIKGGIGVYFTRLRFAGIDFAILEDRKFKSAPEGTIPKQGPRPDHINNPKYDRASIDLPGLTLLGERQLKFLSEWSQDWENAEMKVVLSQTPFAGAAHLHGRKSNRLLADLDSNGWPQKGRNKALTIIRQAWASHLCGDQHLGVTFKQGISSPGDGPMTFSSPAIVNTVYGRWWHPKNEKAGENAVKDSKLPWTGDYLDGFGNHIRMLAYANAKNSKNEKQRADGWGLVRFKKSNFQTTFECWHRYSDVAAEDAKQFDGWPISFKMNENDGRKVIGHLPPLEEDAVIQVIENKTGEILYTLRQRKGFAPPVYAIGEYTLKSGEKLTESKIITQINTLKNK